VIYSDDAAGRYKFSSGCIFCTKKRLLSEKMLDIWNTISYNRVRKEVGRWIKKKKAKIRTMIVEIIIQILTGLITGTALLAIDHLLFE